MRTNDLKRALFLVNKMERSKWIIRQLNEINGGDSLLSIPTEIFEFVDTKLAAKGLLSLMMEASVEMKRELDSLGVEL